MLVMLLIRPELDYFKPQVTQHGPLDAKDVIFYNSRFKNRTKPSSIYPETWSEYVCDLKAIEVAMSNNVEIRLNKNGSAFVFTGKTSDNLEILIHYDIQTKRIKTHHSFINT